MQRAFITHSIQDKENDLIVMSGWFLQMKMGSSYPVYLLWSALRRFHSFRENFLVCLFITHNYILKTTKYYLKNLIGDWKSEINCEKCLHFAWIRVNRNRSQNWLAKETNSIQPTTNGLAFCLSLKPQNNDASIQANSNLLRKSG